MMAQSRKRSRPPRQRRDVACCGGLGQLLSPRVFKALGDPRRVTLLIRLAEAARPCTVGEVARGSSVDLSVVSRHLAILREAGVIRSVKHGKEVWCTVDADGLARMLRDLADAFDACCPSKPARGEAPLSASAEKHGAASRHRR